MKKIHDLIRRAIILRNARDKAQNEEFKKLWNKKMELKLLKKDLLKIFQILNLVLSLI